MTIIYNMITKVMSLNIINNDDKYDETENDKSTDNDLITQALEETETDESINSIEQNKYFNNINYDINNIDLNEIDSDIKPPKTKPKKSKSKKSKSKKIRINENVVTSNDCINMVDKFKQTNGCSTRFVPDYSNNSCDEKNLYDWKLYQPVKSKLDTIPKFDSKGLPRPIRKVFNDSITDFKKINPKLSKNQERSIQGIDKIKSHNYSWKYIGKEDNNKLTDSLYANDPSFETLSSI